MSKKYLVKFNFGLQYAFGESLEVCTEEELLMIRDFTNTNHEIYLGEIEGKHSEIIGPLDHEDWKIISDDQDKITVFEDLVGSNFGAFCMTEKITDYLQENID